MSAPTVRVLTLVALLTGCEESEGALDVTELALDVSASHLVGAFTLGGSSFPATDDESGDLTLTGALPGDQMVLGQTVDQGYEVFVVDGVYDAHYWYAWGEVVPRNQGVEVLGVHGVGGDATVDLEVGVAVVSPTFTLNGQPFPDSADDSATFYLKRVGSDELILLGDSHQANGSVPVVAGTYDVIYDYTAGPTCPINQRARVAQGLVLTAAEETLQIDVVASSLRLTFTLDGEAFPASEYQDATLHLRDEAGEESLLMNTHAPLANVIAIDGTYDVIYRHETGDEVPLNTAAVVVDDVVLADGGALVQDIVTVTIDADVTLDGSPFPVSQYEDANVSLYDPETGADTDLGNTHAPFTGLVLIPGTYDVLYSHESGDDVPQNVRGTVATDVVIDGSPLAVDVRSVEVGAHVTLDGEPFPASEYDDAIFVLTSGPGEPEVVLGNSHDADPTVWVLAGTYDLWYRHETGDAVPQNGNYRLFADQVLNADTVLAADIETRSVRISATLNEAPFPTDDVGAGRVHAQTAEGDEVLLLETGGVDYTVLLIPGDYQFVYEYVSGAEVPVNRWAGFAEATLD